MLQAHLVTWVDGNCLCQQLPSSLEAVVEQSLLSCCQELQHSTAEQQRDVQRRNAWNCRDMYRCQGGKRGSCSPAELCLSWGPQLLLGAAPFLRSVGLRLYRRVLIAIQVMGMVYSRVLLSRALLLLQLVLHNDHLAVL